MVLTVGRENAGIRPHLFALLGYLALALVVTYPAVLHFTTQVPGDLLADRDQNLWNLWWAKQAISLGTNPFHTGLLYYPYGVDLYYHTLALPLGLIGLLPQLLFGLPAAYNTVLIAAFTLSGYGAFRLALLFLHPSTPLRLFAAFLGGVVFAFTPYTLDALKGQPEVLSLQWMPFYAEMWIRAVRQANNHDETTAGKRPWWFYALLAAVFMALAAYSSLYYAVYLVIFTIAHGAYTLLAALRHPGPKPAASRIITNLIRPLAATAIVTLALTLPLLAGLIADRGNPRFAVAADPQHRLAHSADLLSFFAPPHDHLLFGTWQDQPGVKEPLLHDYVGLGYVALALALIGVVAGWRSPGTKFWAGLALLSLVLAMGPELQINRQAMGIPLPFALLDKLPGMDAIAKPERFVVLTRLCMGVLAAVGASWTISKVLSSRPAAQRARQAIAPSVALLTLLLIELPMHPRYIDPLDDLSKYSALMPPGASGAWMELPFATQQVEETGRRMLYQTAHEQPIMAGYLSRRYDSPIIDSCSPFWGFISPLDVPREDIANPLVVNTPLDVLNFYKIRYVALYNKPGGPNGEPIGDEQAAAFSSLIKQVAQEPGTEATPSIDDYMSLYTVKQEAPAAPPSFHIGAGWYPIERSDGTPFRWLQSDSASLCVFTSHALTAPLRMEATAFAQDRQISITAGNRELFAGSLPAGAFTPITTAPLDWQPGVTEVKIASNGTGITPQSVDPNTPDNRALTLGLRRVDLAIQP